MYVQIRVEDCALVFSVMANMMSLFFIIAAAERVSCCVGLVPKLSQGSKFDLDVVIVPAHASAHRTRVLTTVPLICKSQSVYRIQYFRRLLVNMLDASGDDATRF